MKTGVPEPNKWSTVPGSNSIEIYPLIRKPCVTCSNTFILKSDLYTIIIDPGAEREQIERIRRIILLIKRLNYCPVLIFFTHCHIDHYLAVSSLIHSKPGAEIICHKKTAKAIEGRDENITLANMNGSILPVCKVKACFFDDYNEIHFSEKNKLIIEKSIIKIDDNHDVPCQTFAISDNDKMEIFHTPGHSPDSVTYRVGSLLFTGDLHLATTPGIAGKSGWDNKQLSISLRTVLEKCKKDNISAVLPGHGSMLDFSKAEKIFKSTLEDALKLNDISSFNRERSLYLSEYAIVLLEEASNIFSIIAARLLKTSYYLEMLDEEEKAKAILSTIDFDAIDNIINEFKSFFDELKGKRGAPLISKAVNFSRKVNRIFEPEKLSGIFDPRFLHRIRSLLSDFVNVVYGIRFKDQETLFNVNDAVSEVLFYITESTSQKENIFDSLDNEKEFINELTKRIAFTPLFSSIKISFDPTDEELLVIADKYMFLDVLTALLEQFAISEIPTVLLTTHREEKNIILSVTPSLENIKAFVLRESKLLYLEHSMRLAGGEFKKSDDNQNIAYYYIFPD